MASSKIPGGPRALLQTLLLELRGKAVGGKEEGKINGVSLAVPGTARSA